MIQPRTIQLSFFFSMFGLTAILAFFIFRPYLNILVLAGTFAIIFYPTYQKILRRFKTNRPGTAAVLTVLIVGLILGIPLGFLGTRVFTEASSLYQRIGDAAANEEPVFGAFEYSNNAIIRGMQEKFAGLLTKVGNDLDTYAQLALRWIADNAGPFFQGIAQFTLALFLWFLAVYYFLREGHKIKSLLVRFSPLSDRYDLEIVHKITSSVKSVIGGALIIAGLQGILAGIGFAIFGIPTPAIWGFVAIFAALVPTVGTALIAIPACAFLILTGNTMAALGLLLWSVLIVGAIDNIVRPKLLERGIHVHPLAILLSVLGGIAFFGPVGFVTGPIIVSLLSELLTIYQHLVLHKDTASHA